MITIDHIVYATVVRKKQSTHHHALADWMLLLTTNLHCHESEEPKGASNPELAQSLLTPHTTLTFAVSTQKLQSQLPLGEKEFKQEKTEGTSSVQQTSSSLSCSGEAKTIQYRRFRPFSRSGTPLNCSLARKMLQSKPTALRGLHCILHSSMLFFAFRCWMA